MINKWIGIGRLGKDPIIKFLESGNSVCTFSIACDEKWKNKAGEQQEHTEWISIELWGKLAEIAQEYLKKGSLVYLEGKLKTDSYEKDGEKKYRTKVVAHTMKMLGGKPDSKTQTEDAEYAAGTPDDDEQIPF